MRKVINHRGWGTILARGKTSIPELREKFSPGDVMIIVKCAAHFVKLDEEMKQLYKEGGSIWNELEEADS